MTSSVTARCLTAVFLLILVIVPFAAKAQDCDRAETAMRSIAAGVMSEINDTSAGMTARGGAIRAKNLRFNRMRSIVFSGCRVAFDAYVTLERPGRKDGDGTIRIWTDVFRLTETEICLRKWRSFVSLKNVRTGRENRVARNVNNTPDFMFPFSTCYAL